MIDVSKMDVEKIVFHMYCTWYRFRQEKAVQFQQLRKDKAYCNDESIEYHHYLFGYCRGLEIFIYQLQKAMGLLLIGPDIIDAVKSFLGEKGIKFYNDCLQKYGTFSPIIPVSPNTYHPVVWYEAKKLIDFLVSNKKIGIGWTKRDFNDKWQDILAEVLRQDKLNK